MSVSDYLDREERNQIFWIVRAVSPDGLDWTPLPDPLMLHFSDTVTTEY